MNERAESARRAFEAPVLVAALMVVPVILIEENATGQGWLTVAMVANWAIWATFVAEYTVVLSLTDAKAAYTRSAWLDLLIIIVSFPLLPALLAGTRLIRLLRLLRVTRLLAILTRGSLAVAALFSSRKSLGKVALFTVLLAVGAGGMFALVEPDAVNPMDGLWWAIVTLTTVGYGDHVPTSAGGRAIGLVVMVVGIGFVALLTAAIASRFIESDDGGVGAELHRLHERLDRIEELLTNGPEWVPEDGDVRK